jgi:hypothetical protein
MTTVFVQCLHRSAADKPRDSHARSARPRCGEDDSAMYAGSAAAKPHGIVQDRTVARHGR